MVLLRLALDLDRAGRCPGRASIGQSIGRAVSDHGVDEVGGREIADRDPLVVVADDHEPMDVVALHLPGRVADRRASDRTVIAGEVIRWRTARPGQFAQRCSVRAGAEEVGLADDADEAAGGVDDRQPADLVLVDEPGRLGQRGVGRDDDRVAAISSPTVVPVAVGSRWSCSLLAPGPAPAPSGSAAAIARGHVDQPVVGGLDDREVGVDDARRRACRRSGRAGRGPPP